MYSVTKMGVPVGSLAGQLPLDKLTGKEAVIIARQWSQRTDAHETTPVLSSRKVQTSILALLTTLRHQQKLGTIPYRKYTRQRHSQDRDRARGTARVLGRHISRSGHHAAWPRHSATRLSPAQARVTHRHPPRRSPRDLPSVVCHFHEARDLVQISLLSAPNSAQQASHSSSASQSRHLPLHDLYRLSFTRHESTSGRARRQSMVFCRSGPLGSSGHSLLSSREGERGQRVFPV